MMRLLYTFAILCYNQIVDLASLFHKKARMTRLGQWHTNSILRDKIDKNARYIWFHCASLGEFEQGRPMMEAIRKHYPQYKILLTFFSPSGYEVRKNYDGADVICYLPFDIPFKVNKFLNLANPEIAVFIKYEFWLNYLTEAKKRGIRIFIVSAIFRPEQLFFKWYGGWYKKTLYCYERLFVQDEASRKLLADNGITNVEVCGDTRFDRVLEIQRTARPIDFIKPFVDDSKTILVAGSSWPSDEEILIPYFNSHPEIKLIIVPHQIHKEHIASIESMLKRPYVRYSQLESVSLSGKDCLIIDAFGLLASIYKYGHIAYIGGGFFGDGIHNTIEAAVYGIPVIFGPIYNRYKEACDLIACGGGFSIDSGEKFNLLMDELLSVPEKRIKSGKSACEFVQENAGATEKILSHF